jgi:hypothetical protein
MPSPKFDHNTTKDMPGSALGEDELFDKLKRTFPDKTEDEILEMMDADDPAGMEQREERLDQETDN